MSSRTQLSPFPVIGGTSTVSGDMSSSITSLVTIIQKLSLVSYDIAWSGSSPVGSIAIQVSNDYAVTTAGSVTNTGSWSTLPLSASTSVSGNTGTGFIDLDANAGYAMRIVYTRASGTGTMTATVCGKVA